MRYTDRATQDEITERHGQWRRPPSRALDDRYFDGEPLPRQLVPRHWRPEGDVHAGRRVSRSADSTRYFKGPQASVLRDDMRRLTWVAAVEGSTLFLSEYLKPTAAAARVQRHVVAEDSVWRFHIALDKYRGVVTPTWVTRTGDGAALWFDGEQVPTAATDVDFPFSAHSQVPVGRVQSASSPFGVLGYKCRDTGRIFTRRTGERGVEPERVLLDEPTVGGVSFAVVDDRVVARVDLLRGGALVPALLNSTDAGRSFGEPEPIDLTPLLDKGFRAVPGYPVPVVDKGGRVHAPIGMASADEALALNHIVGTDRLVEAIRVDGDLLKGELAVFPSTLGSGNTFGNGVSDGHGLIMVLTTTEGRLFSSNSSAGGSHFPAAMLLNHEMPLVADFCASECYSSGLTPNVVSMDYVFVESNAVGRPVSAEVFIETWDMPLPLPTAHATASGGTVEVEVLNDADLEPGKVTFSFDDPGVVVTGVDITDLRHATVRTNGTDLRGKVIAFDVTTLFHRHYAEAVIG